MGTVNANTPWPTVKSVVIEYDALVCESGRLVAKGTTFMKVYLPILMQTM